ncbi:uncharacterized protein RCC_00303 [Ramularia collo-cygni]|uniref:Uncharacterized protein n=1 Tax=Ramularia collo-cygni TaxID=112498 RepID=A0A2D3UU15_9PEZI|nr:uncharacterized protein RCC_00303 [Ramularia collo-cygni]CZT14326.1 uncharacterized protein RCC_00303 [Ramularia collo-cygni]
MSITHEESAITQVSSKEETTNLEEQQQQLVEEDSQSDMELFRTDSLVEGTPLAGNQSPQYDAFLQSLSNNITSYLSKHPRQTNSKSSGDTQKVLMPRPDKPSRIQRRRQKRGKRTKP